jgi:ketosteroid isomerase-like protein
MRNTLLILLVAGLFACAQQHDQTKTVSSKMIDIEAELASIDETRAAFQLTIKEKRYADLGQLVTSDFKAVSPGSEDWMNYRRLREKSMGKFMYDSIIMRPAETVIVSDSVAYDFGDSKVYYTNEEGETVELRDTFLVILKKDKKDGKWKLHREVASATVE